MSSYALDWSITDGRFRFHWDLLKDVATVQLEGASSRIWSGGLLPLFEIPGDHGAKSCIAAQVKPSHCALAGDHATVTIDLPGYGEGELHLSFANGCIRVEKLLVHWTTSTPPLIAVHWGAKLLTLEQRDVAPDLSRPFWPSWQSDGYCIPSVKGGPVQSFFRRWELGHATLPLGSFGPALGTPYAAAFPRPLFSAAMGNGDGWVAIGCGEVPDGAMLLQIRSSCAMLEYRYREDLWGPPEGSQRTWNEPLRLTWAESAWDAYDRLFNTFEVTPDSGYHQMSLTNTWGDFCHQNFDLGGMIEMAGQHLGAEMLCIDDSWETFVGSGIPFMERFPDFHKNLARARELGMSIGFWLPSGWIVKPEEVGLGHDDLLLGVEGRPRRCNWACNPHEGGRPGPFCLDPSSPNMQRFLAERSRRVVSDLGGALLKVDFAYGMPGPDVAAPRDPAFRGERMGFLLLKLIADSARLVKPAVAMGGFSIHPLMCQVANLVSLDDLGDAGGRVDVRYEAHGHAQWCIWAALAGRFGLAINASCGYNQDNDAEVMLNTAVVGAPGIMLPKAAYDDSTQGMQRRRRALALSRWHRRSTHWRPLWLDSEKGRLGMEPALACWGRLEMLNGSECVTALALRESVLHDSPPMELGIAGWTKRWALIAQDDRSLRESKELACIPIDGAGELHLQLDKTPSQVTLVTTKGEQPSQEAIIDGGSVRIRVPEHPTQPILGYLITSQS